VVPNFHVYSQNDVFVFVAANVYDPELSKKLYQPGLYCCSYEIPAPLLNAGKYQVEAFLSRESDGFPYVHVPEAVSFQVIDDGTGRGDHYMENWPGVIRPKLACSVRRIGELPVI